jgi:hypothetical protein
MRLLRMLAVLLSRILDRVRRALLSWAGVAVNAGTDEATAVDDRPTVWLEYVRARAPGLVAGKRHLPSQTVPIIEPSWPAPSGTAPVDTAGRVPSPPAAVRATPVPRVTAPRVQNPTERAPAKEPHAHAMAVTRGTQDPRRSAPTKPAQPTQRSSDASPQRSSRPIATVARTSGQPATVVHTRAPVPVRQGPEAAPSAIARPPQHPLPDRASRAAAPRVEPSSAASALPALASGPAPEPEAGQPPRVAERPTSARRAPRSVVQTEVLQDESLWADLPDTGLGEWEVQSTRSLIREQLHLARLMKEQAGSSWSALHS